jgi:hypothetical protein
LVQAIQNEVALFAIFGKRVYDEELPDFAIARMPRPTVVLMRSGGAPTAGGSSYNDFSSTRVDVRVFAWKTIQSAADLELKVFDLLRNMPTQTIGDCLIYSLLAAGGPIAVRVMPFPRVQGYPDTEASDVSTRWPYVQRSWSILAADVAAA